MCCHRRSGREGQGCSHRTQRRSPESFHTSFPFTASLLFVRRPGQCTGAPVWALCSLGWPQTKTLQRHPGLHQQSLQGPWTRLVKPCADPCVKCTHTSVSGTHPMVHGKAARTPAEGLWRCSSASEIFVEVRACSSCGIREDDGGPGEGLREDTTRKARLASPLHAGMRSILCPPLLVLLHSIPEGAGPSRCPQHRL